MEDLYKKIYIKYKPFIKNELLYFRDTIFDYFDSTVPNEHEIAILKFKKLNYKVGFLYPSENMEKEDTYNFKEFWIYNEKGKQDLRLSSVTIISDIIVKKNNITFDNNFEDIENIFIIKVKDLIKLN